VILVVAATQEELAGVPADVAVSQACGVGPVEAAARTAAALATLRFDAVVNVGIAGSHSFAEPSFVVGSEAVYCDAVDPGWYALRAVADPALVEAAARALPGASVEPIGTSARVGGTTGCDVEAMEGYAVLRAAALAGVPAVEVRVLANEIGEADRGRWRFADAKVALAEAMPRLVEEVARA
jgi:nucleoside phosphorylase